MDLKNVYQVKKLSDENQVNKLLEGGWELLEIESSSTVIFVLGANKDVFLGAEQNDDGFDIETESKIFAKHLENDKSKHVDV